MQSSQQKYVVQTETSARFVFIIGKVGFPETPLHVNVKFLLEESFNFTKKYVSHKKIFNLNLIGSETLLMKSWLMRERPRVPKHQPSTSTQCNRCSLCVCSMACVFEASQGIDNCLGDTIQELICNDGEKTYLPAARNWPKKVTFI